MTKFLLDSGDPNEYLEISKLAKENGNELWGATTNPSLIAKKLAGKKVSQEEAFELQKEIVLKIINIVPGAVSAEVYADENTTADEMVKQGKEIAKWHMRVVVKLPTTFEGFKARTELRKAKIAVNNTLVFSQEQIFAICLHEQIVKSESDPTNEIWPSFISPFVGRLDDIGQNGMDLIKNSLAMKQDFGFNLWILEASIRKAEHVKLGIDLGTEIMTIPYKVYKEWLLLTDEQKKSLDTKSYAKDLKQIEFWNPSDELLTVEKMGEFMHMIESGQLNIKHPLTDKGITRFVDDWKTILK